MDERFSDRLWRSITPIFTAITDHPFIAGLTDGTLSRERFVFYMQQDSLYLQDFARALGLAGVRSPEPSTLKTFLDFGSTAIAVERSLHESYFDEFGVTEASEKAPACFAYTNYLLAMASTGSYAAAVAALLPCFWIYREVGRHIYGAAAAGLDTNPYRRWIETYAGDAFDEAVKAAIDITEAAAMAATTHERQQMEAAFKTSSRLEWMFWDSAYRLESWPPA